MVNMELLKTCGKDELIAMGFTEENDGSGDPRGVDWNIRNGNFHLMVDAWCEVQLRRINPDTDFITVHIEDLLELELLIEWIKD